MQDGSNEEVDAGGSVYNTYEVRLLPVPAPPSVGFAHACAGQARVLCRLLAELVGDHGVPPHSIGVIVLYKAQQACVRRLLESGGGAALQSVQVCTVDAFQGAEREVMVLSCCRTSRLGFIVSPRRLNVAITRARRHLVVVGSASALARNGVRHQRCASSPSVVER